MSKFKTRRERQLFVILSEFNLLSDELRNELIVFSSETNDHNRRLNEQQAKATISGTKQRSQPEVSAFLRSLNRSSKDILLMDEFEWPMTTSELKSLSELPSGQFLFSQRTFQCKMGGLVAVTFKMAVGRKTHGQFASFGFKVINSRFANISGFYSAQIKELEWCVNESYFYDLKNNEGRMESAFADSKVNLLTTIRFAVSFTNIPG